MVQKLKHKIVKAPFSAPIYETTPSPLHMYRMLITSGMPFQMLTMHIKDMCTH